MNMDGMSVGGTRHCYIGEENEGTEEIMMAFSS